MAKKNNDVTFDEQRHNINTCAPTFLAAVHLIKLVPHNPRQFICPFCGNGSGENGTGVDFDFVKESGEYAYHCFRCQTNFDNVAIAMKVLDQPFFKAIIEATAIINGKVAFEGVQPEYSSDFDESPHEDAPVKDYTKAYEIWQSKLDIYLQNGKFEYRGLTLETLKHFGVGYANDWGEPKTPRIIIPYNANHYIARFCGSDEMLREEKYRGISIKQHSRGVKPIFGLDAVIKAQHAEFVKTERYEAYKREKFREAEEQGKFKRIVSTDPPKFTDGGLGTPIFVVEGEIDAMTGYQLTGGKYHFISLGGCEITRTTRNSLKASKDFPSSYFVVLLDNDKAGNEAKYKVARALIELGHYAIIGNLAKFKSWTSETAKVEIFGDNGKGGCSAQKKQWEYPVHKELMPLEGHNKKHCKDLNDTLERGCWTEAKLILYYLGEIANLLAPYTGNISAEECLVRDFKDLHNIKEQQYLELACQLHYSAVSGARENWDEETRDKVEKGIIADYDDCYYSLFEVPTENAHIRFCDIGVTNFGGGIKTFRTATMEYVPYFMDSYTDENGRFCSKLKAEFVPAEVLKRQAERRNFEEEVDELVDVNEETDEVKELVEENTAGTNQNEVPAAQPEKDSVTPPNEVQDLSTMDNFKPISAGTTTGGVNPDGYGANNPEEQAQDSASSSEASQPANNQPQGALSNFTQDAIESCPINLKTPPLYRFMSIGISSRDSGDMFCHTSVVPTKVLIDVDSGIYYTELAFYDNFYKVWKTIIVEDKVIADPNELLKLNSNGLVFTKKNAKTLSNYLIDIRNLNLRDIPHEALYTNPGWTDNKCTEFLYPDIPVNGKVLKVAGNFLRKKFGTSGDFDEWRKRILLLINTTVGEEMPLGIFFFCFGAALAAPMLRIIGGRSAQYLLWCQSGSGKSALVKTVMSIYGRPEGLKNTFNNTFNSLYDLPKYFNDLPVWVDEVQSASKLLREQFTQFVYGYELGKTKGRLKQTSEMRDTNEFKGIRFMTGEQPMLSPSSDAGASNRLLQISSKHLFKADYNLSEHHNFFDDNFGWFGPMWIQHLSDSAVHTEIKRRYAENKGLMYEISQRQGWTNNWADNFAAVLTALQIGLPLLDPKIYPEWVKIRFLYCVDQLQADLPKTTTFTNSERALSSLEEYINAHPRRFMVESTRENENGSRYTELVMSEAGNALEEQGYIFRDGSVGLTQNEIKNILERELGFNSYESILREWKDENKIFVKAGDARHKYTVAKKMPRPFSKSRRLVLFPPETLNIDIVPSSGRLLIDKSYYEESIDE